MAYISKQNNDICYKSDIIREVADELGIKESEVEEILDINIKYIKKSVKEKNIVIVNLPNLCKLRFNFNLGLSSWHANPTKRDYIGDKIDLLKAYEKNNLQTLNFKPPLYERLWRKLKRIKYVKKTYKNMFNMISEVEEESNRIIKEIS